MTLAARSAASAIGRALVSLTFALVSAGNRRAP
jgi:hypothetical protein